MKHYYTCIFLFLISITAMAQPIVFSRAYDFGSGNLGELWVYDTGYVSISQSYYTTSWFQIDIGEYNLEGDAIDTISHLFDWTNEERGSIENCGDCLEEYVPNRFIYAQTHFDSASFAYIHLIKYNRQWQPLDTLDYTYNDSLTAQIYALKMDTDSSFVITGLVFRPRSSGIPSSKYDLLVARFDTAFNLIWEKRYQDYRARDSYGYVGLELYLDADGSIYIGGYGSYITEKNTSFIFKLNAGGDLLWKHQFSSTDGGGGISIQKRADGKFIFVAPVLTPTDDDPYAERIRFGVFDAQGNVWLDSTIGPLMGLVVMPSLIPTLDGNFLVSGVTHDTNGRMRGLAFKFSGEGDSLWLRTYHYGGEYRNHSEFYNVRATPDSGYVFYGVFYDLYATSKNYNWLVKTDKYGCEVLGCNDVSITENRFEQDIWEVYPNPSKGVFYVQLPEGAEEGELSYKITDAQGKEVLQRSMSQKLNNPIEVDMQVFAKGLYYLHISDGRGFVQVQKLVLE